MNNDPMNIQFQASDSYNRSLNAEATTLNLISKGTSTVTVSGSIATGAPLLQIFSDIVLSSAVSTVDVSGIDEIQITVSGDPIWGRIF